LIGIRGEVRRRTSERFDIATPRNDRCGRGV
jgi:hypothetical protein